jgi:hypothetical protein
MCPWNFVPLGKFHKNLLLILSILYFSTFLQFRDKNLADQLGLVGRAKNNPEGSVEILASGKRKSWKNCLNGAIMDLMKLT